MYDINAAREYLVEIGATQLYLERWDQAVAARKHCLAPRIHQPNYGTLLGTIESGGALGFNSERAAQPDISIVDLKKDGWGKGQEPDLAIVLMKAGTKCDKPENGDGIPVRLSSIAGRRGLDVISFADGTVAAPVNLYQRFVFYGEPTIRVKQHFGWYRGPVSVLREFANLRETELTKVSWQNERFWTGLVAGLRG